MIVRQVWTARHFLAAMLLVTGLFSAHGAIGRPSEPREEVNQAEEPAEAELDRKRLGLSDSSWADLQRAASKAFGQSARLSPGGPGADGATNDQFGTAVAISGMTAVVGAPLDDVVNLAPGVSGNTNTDQGSAYVFVFSAGNWTLQAKLTTPMGLSGDQFGQSVAISGDTIVVGAGLADIGAAADRGSAYVFVRSGLTWTLQANLAASDGAADDNFGGSVDVDGDSIVVGANLDDSTFANQGAAYVFVRDGSAWSQQSKLVAGDPAASSRFGYAVAISGETVLVGAYRADAAYFFQRSGTAWSLPQRVTGTDVTGGDNFGFAVALDADTAVIGVPQDDVASAVDQGSAYVFVRSSGTWVQEKMLVANDGASGDLYGISAAVAGSSVVVGAERDGTGAVPVHGSVHVYTRDTGTWPLQQKLEATGREDSDRFGGAVAIIGDILVSGMRTDNVDGLIDQGTARTFIRNGSSWSPQSTLTAGPGPAGDSFGQSVAISGDTALVGAHRDQVGANINQGSVSVFVRNGGTWLLQQKLTAADGASNDSFGKSVSLSGDTAVIGAVLADVGAVVNQGAAYVYKRTGNTWQLEQKLTGTAGSDEFGESVAIEGETLVVGAYLDDIGTGPVDQGSAYVFTRSGTIWSQQQKLTASDGAAGDWFGASVALSGESALIGAQFHNVGGLSDQGAAYLFVRNAGTWSQQSKLAADDPSAEDRFGVSVALSGETALVGVQLDHIGANADQGSVHVFVRNGSLWNRQAKLTANDGGVNDRFGVTVALSGDVAAIGTREDDIVANVDQGSVYVFRRSGNSWMQQSQLLAADGRAGDYFGDSVALSGDKLLVGATRSDGESPYGNPAEGAAYVFENPGTVTTISQVAPATVNVPYAVAVSVSAAQGVPTGIVDVSDGVDAECRLTLSSGSGSCALTSSSVSSRTITARYRGAVGFAVSEDTESILVKRSQFIEFAPPAGSVTVTVGTVLTLDATSRTISPTTGLPVATGLPITFASITPGACSVSGNQATINSTALCTLSANQVGDASFHPAQQATQNVNSGKDGQVIVFTPPPPQVYAPAGTFQVTASASSGLPVSFASATPGICSTSVAVGNASTVDILAAGACEIVATQAGDASFEPANAERRTIVVQRAPQHIVISDPGPQYFSPGRTFEFTPSSTSTSAFPFVTSTFGSELDVCASDGTTVRILRRESLAPVVCTIVVTQPENSNYLPGNAQRPVDIFVSTTVTGAGATETTSAESDAKGDFLVYQTTGSDADVYRLNARTGETEQISVDDGEQPITGASMEPSVSADGQLVVFVAPNAGINKLLGESLWKRIARQKQGGFIIVLRNLINGTSQRVGTALPTGSGTRPRISADGMGVVATGMNGSQENVFKIPFERMGNTITVQSPHCVSCKTFDAAGQPTNTDANGDSRNPVVSSDGQWVAWETAAKNLLPGIDPCPVASTEILLRNLITGTSQRIGMPTHVSRCSAGGARKPSMDHRGKTLVFESDLPLTSGDTNVATDAFLFDVSTGTMARLSQAADGSQSTAASTAPVISGDGSTVAFASAATNLDPVADAESPDSGTEPDVHVALVRGGRPAAPSRLTREESAQRAGAITHSERPALNLDGTKLMFDSSGGHEPTSLSAGNRRVFQQATPDNIDKVFNSGFE